MKISFSFFPSKGIYTFLREEVFCFFLASYMYVKSEYISEYMMGS